jgi:hypothetical protein
VAGDCLVDLYGHSQVVVACVLDVACLQVVIGASCQTDPGGSAATVEQVVTIVSRATNRKDLKLSIGTHVHVTKI